MINYFNSLHGRDRKLFDKAVQYFLPAIDDTKEQRFYARYNNYSVIRWLNMAGEDIVHDAVRQWSNEEIMKLLYIYNLSFQLENMNSPEMNQEVLEQIFLVLNERGLVQEALSKLQGQAFDKLKSVASQPVLLYEPTRAAVRKKIVALVNQEGVANIQSREFYAGTYYREIDSTLSSYSGSYSSVLRLLMPRDKQYSFEEQMDSVLEVLLYDPAFEPVREGLLYRLFYYLNGLPAEMISYFKVLQGRKSEVFNKVMHYIIPAFPEEGAVSFLIRGSNFWFNQWLNQEREEIIRLAVHQWSKKDVIRLFNAHNRALETQKENQLHPVVIQQIARVLQEQNRLQEILSMVTGRAHDDLQAAADKAMSAQQQQRAFSLKELWLDYGELFDRLKHLDYLVVERGYSAAREQDRDNRANLEKEFTLRREAFIRRFILEGAFTWTDRQEAVNYLRQVLDQTPVYLFNASADEKDAEFKKLEPLLLKILNKPIRVSPAPKARPTLTFADVLMGQKSSGLWQAVSKENSQITEGVFGEPVEIYGEGEREKVLAEVQKQMGRVRDQELVYLAVDVKFWNMVDHIVVIEQASVIRSNLERIIQFHTPSNSDTVKLNEFIFYLNFTQFGLPGNGKGKIYLRKMSVGRDRTEIFTLDKLKAQQDPQSQKGLGTETFENWVKALQGKFHGWTVLAVDGSPRLAPPGNPDDRLPGDGQTWLAHRFNQLLGGVRHVQDESVLGFIRQYGERVSSDEAVDGMVLAGTVPQASNEEAPAGGIDLSVVNVQQSGDTSEAFHFDDATLRQLQEGFEGFDIKIIRVSPVTDLSLYLGLGK